MAKKIANRSQGGWVGYRPELKILDCTVRDGGLINDHFFDDEFVRRVYQTDLAAGIDYWEVGYKASRKIFSPESHGKWKFCSEDDLRRIVGDQPSRDVKITVMADVDRTDYHTDLLPREKSVISCVRIAFYIHQVPAAVEMAKDAAAKGYETMMQLMACSTVNEHDMREALKVIAQSPTQAVYLVDSYGAFYSEQVRDYVRMFLSAMEGTDKEVGFHGHNNQQLAFANTIEAIIAGANRVDTTISGLGRGAGNCPMELLIGFLHNPKFRLRPVLETCRDVFIPLAKKMHWGYSLPYAIAGQMNQHPRAAIEWHAGKTPDDAVAFYDLAMAEE